jgi:hypothetical protein
MTPPTELWIRFNGIEQLARLLACPRQGCCGKTLALIDGELYQLDVMHLLQAMQQGDRIILTTDNRTYPEEALCKH